MQRHCVTQPVLVHYSIVVNPLSTNHKSRLRIPIARWRDEAAAAARVVGGAAPAHARGSHAGIPYEPPPHRAASAADGLGVAGVGIGGGAGGASMYGSSPPSAFVAESRFLKNEQDDAYARSLRDDQLKESAKRREREEAAEAEAAARAKR